MSSKRPPTPIQPPVVNNTVGRMAQLQVLPAFPTFHCPRQSHSGRPASQSSPSISGRLKDEREPLSPIRLPPIESFAPVSQRPSTNVLSISNLLSRHPESPRNTAERDCRHLPQHHAEPHVHYRSSSSNHEQSLHDALPQSYGTHRSHHRPIGQWSNAIPRLTTSSQYGTSQPPQPPQPFTSLDTDRLQHSPANTTYSFGPSFDSGSSVSSPRSSVDPRPAFSPQYSEPPPMLEYHLSIRQQPTAARACGFGERDRRVVDPPPILELKVSNRETGAPERDLGGLLALHCRLLGPEGTDFEAEVLPAEPDMPSTRRLMGTLVASPYEAKDDSGTAGTFFVFPDLSCRSPGQYRLAFKLLRIDPTKMQPGVIHKSVAAITTDAFSVYTAKDFPGMRASSGLLKALRRQGLNVGVKKGSDSRRKGKFKKPSSSDEEEDSDDGRRGNNDSDESGSNVSPKTKGRKKNKRRRQDS